MIMPRALIIDDEPDIRELLAITLSKMGIDVSHAKDCATAKQQLATHQFDLCLTDMKLPDGNGIDLVRHIQHSCPHTPVAVITAHGNMELAIDALKAGAFDFLSKPVDLRNLRNLIKTALKINVKTTKHTAHNKQSQVELLGDSAAIRATRTTIEKLSRSQAPVYISGESGSGKELVARLIHNQGPRANQPFIPVNCGAIPESLMESEFFGHKKGSFTGAISDKPGLFQAADGGTLFLDEVADLPLHMQVKLLRAIQEKTIRPIGVQKEIPVDIRILSATHKNLSKLVADNVFRQDLFYRINVIELHVPSLRERPKDIPILIDHILNKLFLKTEQANIQLNAAAIATLMQYNFPGNVRELENILERAMTLCENNIITPEDLQLNQHQINEAVSQQHQHPQPLIKNHPEMHTSIPEQTDSSSDHASESALDPLLNITEKTAIMQALEKTRYNKTAAAKLLGITFRALRYRLKKYGIN